MPNSLTGKAYPAVDYAQAISQGALCHVSGTYSGTERGVSVIEHATVAYEDVSGRVHASLFGEVRGAFALLEGILPGALVDIVAEPELGPLGVPFYRGAVRDARNPAYDADPASRIDRRRVVDAYAC